MKQFKQLLLTGILLFCIAPAIFAQVKSHQVIRKKSGALKPVAKPAYISPQLKNFLHAADAANVSFTAPKGFKEIKAPDNEDLFFDYAMEVPGKEFEIWFQVKSQKENYASYLKSLGNKNTRQANPDSLYIDMGRASAMAFTGEDDFFTRSIPPKYLERYNADAGKTYLLNLQNLAVTKHYKYALLITLQKDHIGTILAVCLANERGPEFFKNIDKASSCIKFKP
ncbi:hypothetical protein [Mucilaginibacter phyllosphaerae]|uniref:DUF4251 domain-containing protein n=1 Tax=Mucilaginibacter phyllosphaerae TaxID=1812349 RepID=A0ABR6I368_9SPHI|nr:hypothetical protein [Mucilaginibacter phyllosphaerae]MBB3967479.1 hypothetical protein [Mucilaginibacter phyllosphaerae]